MKIQLLYFSDCPNVHAARNALRRCLSAAGLPAEFEEIDLMATTTSVALRAWGSPTILVDGVDVSGEAAPDGASNCRLYPGGVPTDEQIHAALRATRGTDAG